MNNDQILTEILKNSTILYLEDEIDIRENVSKTLKLICKNIIDTQTVQEAKEKYHEGGIDIIISDIELNGESGIEFTKYIRSIDKKTPIIIISAYTEKEYLLNAIKLQLVDYLIKPIDFDDILKTLKNCARFILENGDFFVEFNNGAQYDILNNTIINANEEESNLTNLEKRLLKILIRNKNRTVPTEEIKAYVWENEYPSDSALKSLLNKVRSKIGKESIENISGVGYNLKLKN